MRLLGSCLALTILLGGGLVYLTIAHPQYFPPTYVDYVAQLQEQVQQQVEEIRLRLAGQAIQDLDAPASKDQSTQAASTSRARTARRPQSAAATTPPPSKSAPNQITLYLTNGGVVTGELVSRTAQGVVLRWEYGEVAFSNQDISRLVSGRQIEGEDDVVLPAAVTGARKWKYAHPVVFRLLNGSVVDGTLICVDEQQLQIAQTLEQGGTVEITIPRDQLDQVLFQPVENERSQQIRTFLEATFPAMSWREDGMFVMVTDSALPESINSYWRTIRELATEFYLAYYPLLKDRTPRTQQYVVIFDDWATYIDYALTDGVPGWVAVGYFMPDDEVLYLFNMVGERFSQVLYDAFLGQARAVVDGAVEQVKGAVDSRYHEFLEGQGIEFKAKFERADSVIRAYYRHITDETLRHELTHGLFHAWGLQTVVVSALAEDQKAEAAKKRDYLTSTDAQHKRQLLLELLNPTSRKPLEIQAANSWVVEGLGAFMERLPVGALHADRLYDFQQAQRERLVLPLEFLTAFRMGSFPGIAAKSQLYAYAQSACVVHFLMARYREPFFVYLNRLAACAKQASAQAAGAPSSSQEDDLTWLLDATGKDLRALEQEFLDYMAQFPTQEAPWLDAYDALLEIFRSF